MRREDKRREEKGGKRREEKRREEKRRGEREEWILTAKQTIFQCVCEFTYLDN